MAIPFFLRFFSARLEPTINYVSEHFSGPGLMDFTVEENKTVRRFGSLRRTSRACVYSLVPTVPFHLRMPYFKRLICREINIFFLSVLLFLQLFQPALERCTIYFAKTKTSRKRIVIETTISDARQIIVHKSVEFHGMRGSMLRAH